MFFSDFVRPSACIMWTQWLALLANSCYLRMIALTFRSCCSSFEKLRSVREMEYELDFVTNRANRDAQVCPVFGFLCLG